MRELNSLKESLIQILMGSSEMKRKQYILSILGIFFSGMLLSFVILLLSPKIFFFITENNFKTTGYIILVIFVLLWGLLTFLNKKAHDNPMRSTFWLEIITYYLFWISGCSFYGVCYAFVGSSDPVVPLFYITGIVITLICLPLGLFLPHRFRNLVIIPGIATIVMIVMLVLNFAHADSGFISSLIVIVGVFYCFFLVYQINKLKFDEIDENPIRRWASIFYTAGDMALTFLTMVGAMLALFVKSQDDNQN